MKGTYTFGKQDETVKAGPVSFTIWGELHPDDIAAQADTGDDDTFIELTESDDDVPDDDSEATPPFHDEMADGQVDDADQEMPPASPTPLVETVRRNCRAAPRDGAMGAAPGGAAALDT